MNKKTKSLRIALAAPDTADEFTKKVNTQTKPKPRTVDEIMNQGFPITHQMNLDAARNSASPFRIPSENNYDGLCRDVMNLILKCYDHFSDEDIIEHAKKKNIPRDVMATFSKLWCLDFQRLGYIAEVKPRIYDYSVWKVLNR